MTGQDIDVSGVLDFRTEVDPSISKTSNLNQYGAARAGYWTLPIIVLCLYEVDPAYHPYQERIDHSRISLLWPAQLLARDTGV